LGGAEFTREGQQNREIKVQISKANAVLCELYCTVVTKQVGEELTK